MKGKNDNQTQEVVLELHIERRGSFENNLEAEELKKLGMQVIENDEQESTVSWVTKDKEDKTGE